MKQKPLMASLELVLVLIAFLFTSAAAQEKPYREMGAGERVNFVSDQARRLSRELTGEEYAFTPEYIVEIEKTVDYYANRISPEGRNEFGTHDVRLIFSRGSAVAPEVIKAFRARNLSPLYGLYIAAIESEFVNIRTPNENGAAGMFQFIPSTARQLGLTPDDVFDEGKSADAAARYIQNGLEKFGDESTKGALALLSYNRGSVAVEHDLKVAITESNKSCSICALTAARSQLDKSFQSESVHYVPMFFAVAIVGENPDRFGLKTKPLSSLENR